MLTFLSSEWIAALDEAGADDHDAIDTGTTPMITIEQRVTTGDAEDPSAVSYVVAVHEQGIRVRTGSDPDADVTFVADRDTAAAIAQGTLSAQAAFMSGDLRLIGEASALLRSHAALGHLADRFAAVRARTRW